MTEQATIVRARAPTAGSRSIRVGILTGSVTASGGGVAECVHAVGSALVAARGCEVAIFSLDTGEPLDRAGSCGIHLARPSGPGSFGYSTGLVPAMLAADLDVLHVHGLWMYMSVAAMRWSARTGRPYVVSPHGMLDPWAVRNSAWKKRIAAALYERRHLAHAGCLHALCDAELRAIRTFGLRNSVCVIPNGVDAAGPGTARLPEWRRRLPRDARILLYLGRLHPKKGAHDLIAAWHDAAADRTTPGGEWHLVIAGPGPVDYVDGLRRQIGSLAMGDSVHLIGPQYGADKAASFAAAHAFVLPSVSEGQPMAVLEAWSHALPVLLTPDCNLPEGFDAGAAIRIDAGREGIGAGLCRLFAMTQRERESMGLNGRALAQSRFNWNRTAEQIETVYRWLLTGGPRPTSVRP